ncbi:hypothetical protein GBC03_10975 [Citrobacter telavivensis]|uniref:DUF551 domain-containing protein n=1 Tax=Citrobacter telavivensis TaxID=2653932 RepID=A0A6L5EGI9_9ENTR|nr:hypothetical protein [Citrobacter telavivensis]MPQ54486.1 hypothetical protein [Citrobacter telavivensis]QFS70687.1 hypothetical protein GBC03_10975 [Citrobacter telavivensis]
MTTITKERVAEIIHAAGLEPCDYEEVFGSIKTGEIVAMARIALASLEAEPVGTFRKGPCGYSPSFHEDAMPLYAAPPAPVVPEEMTMADAIMEIDAKDADRWTGRIGFKKGWNACRAAMLQGTDGKPELTVWYGSMPETNGKTNWTAMLHRKGQHPWEGITIDRSEYPDRVRYEADRMSHLIGELADEPDILAYDADAHSGYVEPVSNRDELPVSEIECDICGFKSTDPDGAHYCCEDNSND